MPMRTVDILKELLSTEGIRESLVVGRDGFVIDHAGAMDADAVGAIVSTAIGAMEAMGRDTDQGNLYEFMAEYNDGVMLVAPVGRDAVLGVVAVADSALGRVRHSFKKNLRELERVL